MTYVLLVFRLIPLAVWILYVFLHGTMFLLIHHSIRKFEINMRKIILFVVLSFILLMVCCNRVTEKDILGVYAEKHQFYKYTIWILPNGEFRQKAYNRDGSLFYDAKSHWNLEDGMIIVDSLFWFPEGCDNDDIVYDAKNVGSVFFKISRKNGIYAVYVPYWIELDKGIYFYKVEDG